MNLEYFSQKDFYKALQQFFADLNIPLNPVTEAPGNPKDILSTTFNPNNPAHQLMDDVYFVGMVSEEAFTRQQATEYTAVAQDIKTRDYDGLLLFGVTLKNSDRLPSRTQLADITRAFNREFHYTPVVVIFKYGETISFANCERLAYKQAYREGEKAGKVSLLKDISFLNPHTGHLKILQSLEITRSGSKAVNTYAALYKYWQTVFNVSILNKHFYQDLSNWYFWALTQVSFPEDLEKNLEIRNATNLIRLITRIIFIWFIKEKGLVPEKLFKAEELQKILKDFGSTTESDSYYLAILQNLFFGTLNQRMNERGFTKDGSHNQNKSEYGVKTLYRYANRFAISEIEAESLFAEIPFLNGGLFDCLDKENDAGTVIYVDGFSRNPRKQAKVPDHLFFTDEQEVDLNSTYNTRNKRYKVKGLINILSSYKFTIAENTPLEEEVALDPELLGQVFENLLASYNPETRTTARNQTGSFYTPREIVNHMVDESLLAYLLTKLPGKEDTEKRLRSLLSYFETGNPFTQEETALLIGAIDALKLLDPACGSGAFPMGALHKLVHLLHKLDPGNERWKQRQIERVRLIEDVSIREKVVEDIEAAFNNNELDYGRKLYLIENCIYGVDIQPIAVQIAKLRFFISLIIDQNRQPDRDNLGIRALPNLETKFVAADTLIGLGKVDSIFRTEEIVRLEKELKSVRHDYFSAKTRKEKMNCQKRDKELRGTIADELKALRYSVEDVERLATFDPYDQNIHAGFFDPEWMFALDDGFDIVIGNPPYIQIQSFSGQPVQKQWEAQKYATYTKTGDVYCLFYERGFNLLAPNGVLTYISSNKWMRAGYGKALRKFFLEQGKIGQLIDFGDSPIFENATTYTNILVLHNNTDSRQIQAWDLSKAYADDTSLESMLEKQGMNGPIFSEDSFIIATGGQTLIKKRIEDVGVPLKKWDISINYGIKTGLNEAFIINGKKKDELIAQDSKSIEIIKPILRGRDIKRYKAEFTDLWLINAHNGYGNVPRINVPKDYPAIWEHLQRVNTATNGGLEKRQDKGVHWSNLRSCAYLPECEKEKIVYAEIVFDSAFYYDKKRFYPEATSFLMTGERLKYLTALLNSTLLTYAFKTFYAGGDLRGDTFRYKKVFLENLPIPKISPAAQLPYECLVDCVLFAHEKGLTSEASTFEWVINVMVYGLYFEAEMKKNYCYINDLVGEVVKPFKADDTDEFKTEYVQKLNLFLLKNKDIYRGLVHSRNVGPVEIIVEARKK